PDGKQLSNPGGVDDREFTAEKSGTYLVLIEGRVWATTTAQDYRFTLHRASSPLTPVDIEGDNTLPSLLRPGKVGNALSLTTHEQIEIADPALDLRDSLTIEFWIDPDRM